MGCHSQLQIRTDVGTWMHRLALTAHKKLPNPCISAVFAISWEHRHGKTEQLENKISISIPHYEVLCGSAAVWKYMLYPDPENLATHAPSQLLPYLENTHY